ncbi:hypothetical protein OAA57_00460 [bacterium]|nr:hypothetical protein [bacterium]MDB4350034.1 hypothetical protein [bacterium]
MNVQELLNLRTRFEETTEDFKLDQVGSDINSLKWFLENGHKSNSLRNGYQEAYEIAEAIITEYENGGQENNRGFG